MPTIRPVSGEGLFVPTDVTRPDDVEASWRSRADAERGRSSVRGAVGQMPVGDDGEATRLGLDARGDEVPDQALHLVPCVAHGDRLARSRLHRGSVAREGDRGADI